MWWHGGWNGWAWVAMSLSMTLFWGVVVWGAVTLARRGALGATSRPSDPEQILRERFARGEIDEDEFERRRRFLRG